MAAFATMCVLAVCGNSLASYRASGSGGATRQDRVESHLAPLSIGSTTLFSLSLRDLMRVLAVPGMSVAVIDHFQVDWARGYGVARAGSRMPVTPQTLFQAGSVSKPAAAVGALALVESGALASTKT